MTSISHFSHFMLCIPVPGGLRPRDYQPEDICHTRTAGTVCRAVPMAQHPWQCNKRDLAQNGPPELSTTSTKRHHREHYPSLDKLEGSPRLPRTIAAIAHHLLVYGLFFCWLGHIYMISFFLEINKRKISNVVPNIIGYIN